MSTTLIVSLVLALGAAFTTGFNVYDQIRNKRREHAKLTGEIQLSRGQYDELAAKAAQITSQERIETERWWKEQFDAVRDELTIEQRWRRRVTTYIREHTPWDMKAYEELKKAGIDIPPPPILEVNEVDR